MTRGKYGVRAANRLAEIDAGLVQELRQKLAEVSVERDEARATLEQFHRDKASVAAELAAELAEEAVTELATKLIEARDAREADRLRYAMGVSKVVNQPGLVKMPANLWADLADVFGLKGADLMRFFGKTTGHPRGLALARTRTLRRVDDLRAQDRGTSNEVAIRLDDDRS